MSDLKIGEIIELPEKKRDIHFNKIGGLKVKILKIHGRHNQLADVKILATGNETIIII